MVKKRESEKQSQLLRFEKENFDVFVKEEKVIEKKIDSLKEQIKVLEEEKVTKMKKFFPVIYKSGKKMNDWSFLKYRRIRPNPQRTNVIATSVCLKKNLETAYQNDKNFFEDQQ